MSDTVDITYGGRTLRATVVTFVPNAESVQYATAELDTNGGIVPVWKMHSFGYDGSGNLTSDTITDGDDTWVRTYSWANGAQATDSGWVKQ